MKLFRSLAQKSYQRRAERAVEAYLQKTSHVELYESSGSADDEQMPEVIIKAEVRRREGLKRFCLSAEYSAIEALASLDQIPPMAISFYNSTSDGAIVLKGDITFPHGVEKAGEATIYFYPVMLLFPSSISKRKEFAVE